MFAIFGLGPSEMIVGVLCMGVLAGVVILVVVLTTQNNRDRERSFRPARAGTRLGVPVDEHAGMIRVVESDPELIAVVEAWPRLPGHVRSAIRELVRGSPDARTVPEREPPRDVPPIVETGIRPTTPAPDQPLGGSAEVR
jgi:hypothetical protein